MEPIYDPEVIARMQATLDLYEAAEQMMWQNLLREYPHESEAQLKRRLRAWRLKLSLAELDELGL